jgi:toxin ParE1/3/4
MLADNPKAGKNYDKVEPKLLGFKFGRHIIFYESIENSTIEINRILHESMDLKNRLKK